MFKSSGPPKLFKNYKNIAGIFILKTSKVHGILQRWKSGNPVKSSWTFGVKNGSKFRKAPSPNPESI